MHKFRPAALRPSWSLGLVMSVLFGLASGPLLAAGMSIGQNDVFNLNNASVDLDCGDLVVAGTLNMGSGSFNRVGSVSISGTVNGDSGTINMSGSWSNTGTFNAGTGQVNITDTCSTTPATISGFSTFNKLTVQTAVGRQLNFEAGSTTAVSGHLIMNGVHPDNLLKIRSSSPGTPANLVVTGTYLINQVDVRDNHAQVPGEWIDFGPADDFQSIDSGGNARWFRSGGPGTDILRFTVTKSFDDGNTDGVRVNMSCNTGVLLDNTAIVTAARPITFVLTSVDAQVEGPNCRIWEVGSSGYKATYRIDDCSDYAGDCKAVNEGPEQGCFYEDVLPGDDPHNYCDISNVLQPVAFTVNKEWLSSGPSQDVPLTAELEVKCSATATGHEDSWKWLVNGDESMKLDIYPRWQGDTVCTVKEDELKLVAIESEGCDDNYAFKPGDADTFCTMTNIVFFEGIPTLSTLGLALLALLMLGVGMVSYRRFI